MRKKTFTPKQKVIRAIPYPLLSILIEKNVLNLFLKNTCTENSESEILSLCEEKKASSFLNKAFLWSSDYAYDDFSQYYYWNDIYVNLRCMGD